MPRHVLIVFLALVCGLLRSEPAPAGEKPVFGVCVMATRHQYFRDMVDEIKKEAKAAGVDILVGDADFSLQRQIDQVESFIGRKVSLIMIAPVDSRAIVPALEKARAAGIPVLTMDVEADWPYSIAHCASDNLAGGRLAGGLLLEQLRELGRFDQGTILVLDHDGVTSTFQRVKGFADVLRLRGRQFKVEVRDAVGQSDFARERTDEFIASPDSDLVGVFCANDGMTLGALRAMAEAGRGDNIAIVGYDYVDELVKAVDEGRLYGIVIQFPRKIGAAAFRIAYEYAAGINRRPDKYTLVEVGTYLREGFFDQRSNAIPPPFR